jgi:hypothetical protein
MSKKTKWPEQPSGLYAALPHAVLDSVAYQGASHTAKNLLIEAVRQHNGKNNGHLQLSTSWLKKRGWTSADVIHRAKLELVKRGLLLKTRFGGLNNGPDHWALNWLAISEPSALDVRHVDRAWAFYKDPEKQKKRSVPQNGAVLPARTDVPRSVPFDGSKMASLPVVAVPSNGNNEHNHVLSSCGGVKRIVGKVGKSGRPCTAAAWLEDASPLQSAQLDEHVPEQGHNRLHS